MRKWAIASMGAAVAALTILPITAAAASPANVRHDVLTIIKVRGPNVKVKAVLKANLKPKTAAVFATSLATLRCKKSTVTEKVTKNPARPGAAQVSLTSQTFGSCSITGISGATVKVIKLNKLPYKVSISDRKGLPVTVNGPSTSFTVSVSGIGSISCNYKAKKITGHASNKTHLITFSKQTFAVAAGSNGFCPAKGTFTAAYGPTRDTSVRHHPRVFVS